jgi:DNA gyrase subunit A
MTTTYDDQNIILRSVEEEMRESYLRYSMSVIISRALPDVRDGLKPSQRRILYAMRQLNLTPGAKHRKCAKICGDTSGDFHPHGELVIYPTLVRMAQYWSLRYPLIQGQGNFGSVDGDPPAQMRYTEARMTAAAMELMDDLNKDTVDLVLNYDETKLEPTVFPAKFPNLLCNGSSGIAVGMATNIPSHNLKELIAATKLVIDDPSVGVDELMKVMPGPDFPTGGIICGLRGVREAFYTGRGKLALRGVIRIEEMTEKAIEGRQRLVVDELPYNVNKSRLIEHIAQLINSKDIVGVSDLRDESDKRGMRIVLELKRGEFPEVIINQLYKFTDLQTTFGCNMLALDKGLPRTMGVKQMISCWVEHRTEVVRRRTSFELDKAESRAHILEGYLKSVSGLDTVVEIIKRSANREAAKAKLIENFDLSDRQAQAVLDLRLYQLTGLEQDKIQDEYEKLLEKIKYLRSILASSELVKEIIKKELDEVSQADKQERRTQIIAADTDMNMEDLIANESTIITLSSDDYIKRMPMSTFKEQRRGGQGVAGIAWQKDNDYLKDLYVVSTHDHLLIFTNKGRCYWLKAWQIPEASRRSKGRPLVNLLEDIQPDEKISTVLKIPSFEDEGYVFLVTKNGIVKKSTLQDYSNPRRKGVWAVNLDEGDELISARTVFEDDQVMLFTKNGMAVRFAQEDARSMGRVARGVKGISLKEKDDEVVSCVVAKEGKSVLVVCLKGFGKRTPVEDFRMTKRGGVGVRSIITSDRNGLVLGAVCVDDDDNGVLLMSKKGQSLRLSMSDVRVMGRSTQGVRLVALKDSTDSLVAFQKVEAEMEDEIDEELENVSSDTSQVEVEAEVNVSDDSSKEVEPETKEEESEES